MQEMLRITDTSISQIKYADKIEVYSLNRNETKDLKKLKKKLYFAQYFKTYLQIGIIKLFNPYSTIFIEK